MSDDKFTSAEFQMAASRDDIPSSLVEMLEYAASILREREQAVPFGWLAHGTEALESHNAGYFFEKHREDAEDSAREHECSGIESFAVYTHPAQAVSVPDGWSMGDVDTTASQEEAVWLSDGHSVQFIHPGDSGASNLPFRFIKAMLASAPTAPAGDERDA